MPRRLRDPRAGILGCLQDHAGQLPGDHQQRAPAVAEHHCAVDQGRVAEPAGLLPGQYVNLQVPGTGQTRAYSFSSLQKGGEVSFLIRNVPGGLMSSFLSGMAKAGDSLTLAGPLGSFYLREIKRPLLLLAGGTGLAPFTAMLEDRRAGQRASAASDLRRLNDFDLVEMDRLEDFAARIPNFTYSACVSSSDSQYPHKGYVTQHIEPKHLNDGEVDIYLCGPPPMVESVNQFIREQGLQPANFYYEVRRQRLIHRSQGGQLRRIAHRILVIPEVWVDEHTISEQGRGDHRRGPRHRSPCRRAIRREGGRLVAVDRSNWSMSWPIDRGRAPTY